MCFLSSSFRWYFGLLKWTSIWNIMDICNIISQHVTLGHPSVVGAKSDRYSRGQGRPMFHNVHSTDDREWPKSTLVKGKANSEMVGFLWSHEWPMYIVIETYIYLMIFCSNTLFPVYGGRHFDRCLKFCQCHVVTHECRSRRTMNDRNEC